MLFNSIQFLLFFVVVSILFYELPHRYRWLLLLLASCYFYMIFLPVYILILGFTIVVDYFAGLGIERYKGRKKKWLLLSSIIVNVGVLAFFKYWNFLNENLTQLLHSFGSVNQIPYLSIILPIGLSFHTFQAMSYTIEVYRGNQKAEKHFGIYSLYVMFYPQLVAGPIERPQNMLHQFHEVKYFNSDKIKKGLMLVAFGFFKKVVIADRLSIFADHAYNNVGEMNGITLLLATVFFAFQIYCDFSGYSDIALGTANVMGYDLMENFKTPYFSKKINEFWRRWHISLSTWFRDYVYVPLGGNKKGFVFTCINLLIIFLISGLWHGANWTFVIWGGLHGLYLIAGLLKDRYLPKLQMPDYLAIVFTFLLVCFAWIFFRANSVSDAFTVISKIGNLKLNDVLISPFNVVEMIFSVVLILLLLVKEKWMYVIPVTNKYSFYVSFGLLVFLCYFFGVFNLSQFIYFQF